MPADYNEYVLHLAHQHGLINDDQFHAVAAILAANPTLPVIELLYEQQIVNEAQRAWLYEALQHPSPDEEDRSSADPAAAEPAATPAAAHIVVEAEPASVSVGDFRHIDDYLRYGLQSGASDVHLGPDAPPIMRQSGRLVHMVPGLPLFAKAETERLARGFLTPEQVARIEEFGSLDICYEMPGLARFRASVVRQRRGWECVFRIINAKVLTMDQLHLPEALRTLTRYHNGLVLVTGAMGSGKSTTLAAMIEQINMDRHDHIITLEDPIECVFDPKGCQISQREVHTHTDSFAAALRAALREDPDVIMVGEMRDLETIQLAITASETGHLVLGTLHTSTAPRTLDRLLDVFPIQQQSQIRTMVSESIRGIVCQQLIPRVGGQGRALAMEIMTNTPAVGALIRDAKSFMLPGVIQTGRKQGMRLMDDSLLELLDEGAITAEDAYNRSDNKKTFAQEIARRQRH